MSTSPIKGYQDLSTAKIKAVNENKILEELVLRQFEMIAADSVLAADPRWMAVGKTAIEQAFMALNRAVFQPQRLRPNTEQLEEFEVAAEMMLERLLRTA